MMLRRISYVLVLLLLLNVITYAQKVSTTDFQDSSTAALEALEDYVNETETTEPSTTNVDDPENAPLPNVPEPVIPDEYETETEGTDTSTQKDQIQRDYPHLDAPDIPFIEPSKPSIDHVNISIIDEFLQHLLPELAEFIRQRTADAESEEKSSASKDDITNKLLSKLDRSDLQFDGQTSGDIHATTKVFLTNVPVIIKTVVSNIKAAGSEDCSAQFTFLRNTFCVKFDLDIAPLTKSLNVHPTEEHRTASTNVSIESFKVSNANEVDTPPALWQQWLNTPPAADQSPQLSDDASPTVVCYYTNWAQYRNGPGRFYPENLDPNLCTHIVYAFAKLQNGVIAAYEWNDESTQWSTGMYARMMNLRKASKPKILLALGGWNHGSGKFSDMVHNDTLRETFVTTTIIFLQKNRFDGLDLDWEYPGSREGSRPSDKDNFTKLVTELKKAFRPLGLLLTAAVGAGKPTIDAAYDIPKVCEQLDMVNLMSYDLHGSWESQTGINAPLYSRENDTKLNKQLTADWAVRYWLDGGCPKSKLIMGLALYGRTFRLASPSNNKVGAPAVGPGTAGLYTGEAGFLAYYEICTRIQQQGWTKVYDPEQASNYAYKGSEWVGFDDAYSLSLKVKYAKDMGLAGIMFWAPDLDDFTGGLCSEGKYPLMNTAVNLLRGNTELITSTKTPVTVLTTTTVPAITTTESPTDSKQRRIVCYYTNWAQYRPGAGKFEPENLDPSLCTHIIYAFAVIKDSKLVSFEWNDEDNEWSKGMFNRVLALKKISPVKILLAVGGWNFGSAAFSDLVRDDSLRKAFVQQATEFILSHGFDGFDLDWEYPGSREGSRPEDKDHFTTLVKELKDAFKPHNLLLTAAVAAGASEIEKGYDIEEIASYLDFINLMTYDLHGGSWENSTGLHTALYARPEEKGSQITLNQNWAVNQWIARGMPKDKICMGLAFYGRTFKLANSSDTGIGAPALGPGEPGTYTRESGFLAYYEICEKLKNNNWTSKYDKVQKSMYAYGDGDWVGYDNIDTLTIRANYIIGKDLGGVMVWAPDLDDFSGQFCGRGRYPLLNTVVNIIRTNTIVPLVEPTDTTDTTTTVPIIITTPSTTSATTSPSTTITQTPPVPTTITPTPSSPATTTTTTKPTSPSSVATSPTVVCMTSINPFVFDTLDVSLCSHLILIREETFATNSDIFQTPLSTDTINRLTKMRNTNSKLKILYCILGQWKVKHLSLIRETKQRAEFNNQIQQFLIDNHLDGLDIDWNLRAQDIASSDDKDHLSTWLSELKAIFASGQFLLSIGISGDKVVLDSSYDFDTITSVVSFIRFMAFDWPSKNVTSLINPLFAASKQDDDQSNNINSAIDYLVELGVAPEIVSLGLPTYGRLFGLVDGEQNKIGSQTVGASITVAYSDICKLIQNTDYIKVYYQPSRSTYIINVKRKQWISSDTVTDVALKARFAKLQGLGGVTLSSVGMDDVNGQCGNGRYPLLHAVADVFGLKSDRRIDGTDANPSQQSSGHKSNVFCSISSQVETYSGQVQFTLDKINTRLCTHLLINHTSSLITDSVSKNLKNTNADLKILLTVSSNSDINVEQWKDLLTNKSADGININIDDQTVSQTLVKQIQTIRPSLPKNYLLTISFQAPTDSANQVSFFNILALHPYVDYLFLLPFDEKSISNFTEIQSWNSLVLFTPANIEKRIGDFSIVSMLLFSFSTGVPKEKLVMSIPTYGLTFVLQDENKYQVGDKIIAQGFPGRLTHTIGMLSSYEICQRIESDGYERFLSNQSITVLAHRGKNLIMFDDTHPLKISDKQVVNGTVELKATFLKKSQLAGVLVHSIDLDDFTGLSCERGPFPITSVISRIFLQSPSSPSLPIQPIQTNTTTTTTTTPIPSISTPNVCSNVTSPDLVADEDDCHFYYVCLPTQTEPAGRFQCAANKYFSREQKACAEERSSCSSESKFKPTEATTSTSKSDFVCPTTSGVFPNPSDCKRYFICSNNYPIPFKCPLTTKFNSRINRCDWSSDLCP